MRTLLLALGLSLCLGCNDASSTAGAQATDAQQNGAGDATLQADAQPTADTTIAQQDVTTPDVASSDVAADVPKGPAAPEEIGPADRPARVWAPANWSSGQKWPLVLVLHGYGASGALQTVYLGIGARAEAQGFVAVAPDGSLDPSGQRYWNATDACCDFAKSPVDDVAYLSSLIDESIAKLHVDPSRVFVVGHSNGGFMALRLACEKSEQITAVASLAGATTADFSTCKPSKPVSVLQIHGTADAVILYAGGLIWGKPYPAAETTVGNWRTRNACPDAAASDPAADYDGVIPGDETTRTHWEKCASDTRVDLWSIVGGAHIPPLTEGFKDDLVAWLLARTRTAP